MPIFRPLVEYCDHGTNHWLGTPADMAKEQAYRLPRRMLIAAFGQRLGLCGAVPYAKRELRSKPQPTPDDLACYLKIVRRATHLNWFRRLELQFILWRDFRRLRKSGPIPAPDAEPSTTT